MLPPFIPSDRIIEFHSPRESNFISYYVNRLALVAEYANPNKRHGTGYEGYQGQKSRTRNETVGIERMESNKMDIRGAYATQSQIQQRTYPSLPQQARKGSVDVNE